MKAPVSESSLINLQALRTPTLLKRDSNTGFFLCFKNTFFHRPSLAAAAESFRFLACNFIKKETPAKMFFCGFCKDRLLTEHLRMTVSCVYLGILRSFLKHLSYRAPMGNCLFHVQVAEF